MGFAQQLLLLFEIGDWAEAVLDLPGVGDSPLGPEVAGVAAMSQWWRGDLAKFVQLTELAVAMPAASRTRLYPAALEALLLLVNGQGHKAADVISRIDPGDSQRTASAQAWLRVSYRPTGEGVSKDIGLLAAETERTNSPLIRTLHLTCLGACAAAEGRYQEASSAARAAIATATSMGATFFVHSNVPRLISSSAMVGAVPAQDLGLARDSLKEQRDAGQELDQWLILAGVAEALFRHQRSELALEVARGYQSSVWGRSGSLRPDSLLPTPTASIDHPSDEAPAQSLNDLVDQVLTALDDIIDELGR